MPSIDDIYIIKNRSIGDKRGDVFHWDLQNIGIEHIYIYHRKKGIKSWGHFHKGKNPSRDPERLFLIEGKIKFYFEDVNGRNKELVLNKNEILITPKFIFHKYEILEYSIFIEPRIVTEEDLPDTYDYKEFSKFIF